MCGWPAVNHRHGSSDVLKISSCRRLTSAAASRATKYDPSQSLRRTQDGLNANSASGAQGGFPSAAGAMTIADRAGHRDDPRRTGHALNERPDRHGNAAEETAERRGETKQQRRCRRDDFPRPED
jgi:hypothetical protein